MATYWINLKTGNDANAGTYAAPWRTFTNGPTAARIGPDDEIRVMRSDVATLANTTWTNNSANVTIPANTILDIETGIGNTWTAATNVTGATSTVRRLGATSQQLTIAAAFTTGKVAHKATGALNLSGYTKFSFWLRTTNNIPAGSLTLRLCSDTNGDTPVHTYTIPNVSNTNVMLTFENGAALSSSINSVSISAVTDPGNIAFSIQNIIAHNDLGLGSIVGPSSSEAVYGILSISGTTLVLDKAVNTGATGSAWVGTTGTYTMTIIDSIRTEETGQSFTFNEAGNFNYTLSGGWQNETTQNGYTIVRSLGLNASVTGWILKNFGFAYVNAVNAITVVSNGTLDLENILIANCATALTLSQQPGVNIVLKNINVSGVNTTFNSSTNMQAKFINCSFINNTTITPGTNWQFINCTFKGFSSPILATTASSDVLFYKCTITGTLINANQPSLKSFVIEEKTVGATYPVNIYTIGASAIRWQTTTKQGADPGAWEFNTVQSGRPANNPINFKLAEIFCQAGVAKTVSVWMQKSHATNGACSLVVEGDRLNGVPETSTQKANNTNWEQVSVTFTPTETGVIGIFARVWYVAANSNVFVGSITVT